MRRDMRRRTNGSPNDQPDLFEGVGFPDPAPPTNEPVWSGSPPAPATGPQPQTSILARSPASSAAPDLRVATRGRRARKEEGGERARKRAVLPKREPRQGLGHDAETVTTLMPRFTAEEASEMLAVSPKTLEAWRRLGRGPRFVKLGRAVRYSLQDLEEFSRRRTVSNSAEGRMLDAQNRSLPRKG